MGFRPKRSPCFPLGASPVWKKCQRTPNRSYWLPWPGRPSILLLRGCCTSLWGHLISLSIRRTQIPLVPSVATILFFISFSPIYLLLSSMLFRLSLWLVGGYC